jgi:hypothetical protein
MSKPTDTPRNGLWAVTPQDLALTDVVLRLSDAHARLARARAILDRLEAQRKKSDPQN